MSRRTHDILRSERGFSLSETLVTLAILTLVTAVVAAGVPSAWRAYVNTVDATNAQLLLATTSQRLREELSVADPSTVVTGGEGYLVRFDSFETGFETTMASSDDAGITVAEQAPGDAAPAPVTSALVPAKASAGAGSLLCATAGSISYDEEAGTFTVHDLAVKRDGEVIAGAKADTFVVAVLAGPAPVADGD